MSAIGCVRFYRAGLVTWRTCYPFAILGLPFSLIGGALRLPAGVYHPAVGSLLLIAGAQMLRPVSGRGGEAHSKGPPFMPSLAAGGVAGIVSSVTGVGGGIFLAPLVLALGWAGTRQVAAISAVFNLLNSGAALAGAWATMPDLPGYRDDKRSALAWSLEIEGARPLTSTLAVGTRYAGHGLGGSRNLSTSRRERKAGTTIVRSFVGQ